MRREHKAVIIEVDDLIRINDDFWVVVGVHLGTVNQQDIIALQPLTMREQPNLTALVPRAILECALEGAATGYTHADF